MYIYRYSKVSNFYVGLLSFRCSYWGSRATHSFSGRLLPGAAAKWQQQSWRVCWIKTLWCLGDNSAAKAPWELVAVGCLRLNVGKHHRKDSDIKTIQVAIHDLGEWDGMSQYFWGHFGGSIYQIYQHPVTRCCAAWSSSAARWAAAASLAALAWSHTKKLLRKRWPDGDIFQAKFGKLEVFITVLTSSTSQFRKSWEASSLKETKLPATRRCPAVLSFQG